MNYAEICSLILELDPKIRGVLIYHHNGEMLAGVMRKGIKSYLPREEITKSTHNAILRWETRKMLELGSKYKTDLSVSSLPKKN